MTLAPGERGELLQGRLIEPRGHEAAIRPALPAARLAALVDLRHELARGGPDADQVDLDAALDRLRDLGPDVPAGVLAVAEQDQGARALGDHRRPSGRGR